MPFSSLLHKLYTPKHKFLFANLFPEKGDFSYTKIVRGVTEGGGGFHTPVRGAMFVSNGTVTPGPSRECDITFFAKGRPKSARQSRDSTVAARRVQRVTVPSFQVSRECRSPGLNSYQN